MRTEVENSETEDENCGCNENEIPKRKDLLRYSGLKKVTFENSEDINDSQDVTERRNPVVEGRQSKKREAAKVSLQLPTQPFQIWLQEVGKAKLLTANPGALPTVVAKLAGQAWADMGSASRNVYEIRYNRAELLRPGRVQIVRSGRLLEVPASWLGRQTRKSKLCMSRKRLLRKLLKKDGRQRKIP